MDVRLTSEQEQLRAAAAELAAGLGPGSVAELDDEVRVARLEKALDATGFRVLRSDGASAVEVAIVAEEFGRRLVDVPFLGPVLVDDLQRRLGRTVAVTDEPLTSVDLTGALVGVVESPPELSRLSEEESGRWYALALATSTADILGAARGTHALATEYAAVREQYGAAIGSYQAVAHLLAEGLALIEGAISVARHAAWAVDELPVAEAVDAARIAKIYCARAAMTVCETSIQVHGGIGNTWECLAHVYLRRVLAATEVWPVKLEELTIGLS
ncbi:acyl-CoA dehydrogenase [Mycolicibacterium chubuense]|uniref:Acyl-CoA dehydrogenase n=1 Tax=Mycolicibacterium chubuense TaxID=1800 RepID=A0A0J6WNH9_MYCCU|nr:acyl-CoA dehydrogenase family protein [Mycolicibacterium chubuense]KMO84950.1 Acyl-CoA dehydrogenase [Mycolicibacterium chubuense]ORA44888.1 acyl-CoA dehydrogenase [Mycolicibacterium chubuense]SPY45378.1 acyl-CoA dehydrogenase domain-containing protein [Mycolicibacterium chubuense]